MANITLNPVNSRVNAELNLPGSKSIANRVLLLAALSNGTNIIANVPDVSEDVQLMVAALLKLGVDIERVSSENNSSATYRIIGCDGKFPVKQAEIFCGNSGTTIRFLCAALAVMDGDYVLTGIERMKERPILDLVDALRQVGAVIDYEEKEGFPPLRIRKFVYNGTNKITISGETSSQYITALLMALPLLNKDLIVEIKDELISKPYVDITLNLLKLFGCVITSISNKQFIIDNKINLHAINYTVEPDASSASYFLAFGALNGCITIKNLSKDSFQGDKNFASVLAQMGAKVEYLSNRIKVSKGNLTGITVNMEDMPDVAMTIATIALFAKGTTTINGIQSWKVKETDRLEAMYKELSKFGADVTTTDDSITIKQPNIIKSNICVDTYNDHRIAMCFSLIAAGGHAVTINNYECVGKTFANYFDLFINLQKLHEIKL
ncbi:MAG: 3-phosphoshikimate 1-carboxyvinyltransferase [Neisseriaceae bacterium]